MGFLFRYLCTSISKNTLLNLLGQVSPLIAAIFAIPLVISQISPERFGFLSLAWVIVGYFSFFDLGLGRALTRLIAERLGTTGEVELPEMIRMSLLILFAIGVAAGVILFGLSNWLCSSIIKLPANLIGESVSALQILVLCLPFVTLTTALKGVLEASQRFGWVNTLRIPLGVLTFLIPVWVTTFTNSLIFLCVALAILRFITCLLHWILCYRLYPDWIGWSRPNWSCLKQLLSDGMWLTISNIVGPVMVYLDRFMIGIFTSVVAVAFYTAPYEVVTRLTLIPAALAGVLFPVFASYYSDSYSHAKRIYNISFFILIIVMTPLCLLTAWFSPYWLNTWLGSEYASEGVTVARFLSLGVLFNSLAYLPFSWLQATGRADLTARIHLFEFPFYIITLSILLPIYGINGAAISWTARCIIDAVMMFIVARRNMRASS